MSKLIDKLLDKKDSYVQKRRIKKGFEMALSKVDSIKDKAEAKVDEFRTQMAKSHSAEEVAEILSEEANQLQTIKDCDNTKVVLEQERKNLFDTDVKE